MSISQQFPRIIRPLRFYAVMPDANWVIRMIHAGVDTVQLRCKHLTGKALQAEIQRCVEAAENNHSQLFINDYWQFAIDAGAYGVHLGQEDIADTDIQALLQAGLRLGVSTHSNEELDYALSFSPSYIASGAIFPTNTKVMPTQPQGLERLHQYVQQAGDTPTVAIGGINLDNAKAVLETGVSSIAVVSAITQSSHPEAIVQKFQQLWN